MKLYICFWTEIITYFSAVVAGDNTLGMEVVGPLLD